jgi:acyl-coenzyme A synthetase/AMP-(fatty) acid ligase
MSFSTGTLTSVETRKRFAEDPQLGGGNLLFAAVQANPRPDLPFLISEQPVNGIDGRPKTEFTLAEIDALAQAWSVWYLDKGIVPRDRVAVYMRDGFEDLVQFFALAQIGAIPVLINGRMPAELAAGHCRRTGAKGLFMDAEHAERIAKHLTDVPALSLKVINSEVPPLGAQRLPEKKRYRHAPADPVFLCHSSGTTGVPKAVVWTHRQSIEGVLWLLKEQHESRSEITMMTRPQQIMLSAVPQSHSAGPSFAAGSLLFGIPMIAMSDTSGTNVLAAIERYQPTTVVAFAETYAQIAAENPEPRRLASVATWFNTGDSAHKRHIAPLVRGGRRWIDGQWVDGSEFIDGLGSSELGFAQFLQITTKDSLRHDRCVGKPHIFAQPTVLREDGEPAPVGEVGLLGVKSPTITPGYWSDSDTTYRSLLRGYWLSGDLVYRDANGHYFHMDRAVDAIPMSSGRAYSLLMEEILLAHMPEIIDCAVVAAPFGGAALPVAIVSLAQGEYDAKSLLSRANEALRAEKQPELAMLDITGPGNEVPFGPTGKVLKRSLRERYREALSAPRQDTPKRAYAQLAEAKR